jgi:uncharacterized protein (TIGR03067 family)
MRTLLAALWLAAGTAGALADDKADLDKIQGTWQTMIGPNKAIPMTMEIKGHELTLSFTGPGGDAVTLKGEVKLDPEKAPKQMDWVNMSRGDTKLPDTMAIYELDGDTLKVRGSGFKKERPTEFAKEGKDTAQTLTFSRKGKDEPKKDEKKDASKESK